MVSFQCINKNKVEQVVGFSAIGVHFHVILTTDFNSHPMKNHDNFSEQTV